MQIKLGPKELNTDINDVTNLLCYFMIVVIVLIVFQQHDITYCAFLPMHENNENNITYLK